MKALKAVLLGAALMLALTACSSDKTLDMAQTCDTILTTVVFDDEMLKAEPSVVETLYSLPASGIEEAAVYVSASGATANEFALFKVKDSEAASAVKTALTRRAETLKTNFENYVPDELNRINGKLILQQGNYLLFAVTNYNDDIRDIFDNALS